MSPTKNRRRTSGSRTPTREPTPSQHTWNRDTTENRIEYAESATTDDMYLGDDIHDMGTSKYAHQNVNDPFAGQDLEQLDTSLRGLINDMAVLLDRLPENYMFDPLTQNACKNMFRKIIGDTPNAITEGISTLTKCMTTEFGRLNHSINAMGQRLYDVDRTLANNTNFANTQPRTSHNPGPTASAHPSHTQTNPTNSDKRTNLQDNQKKTKPAANPLNAHHPSRLVIQILPEGIKPEDRPDPNELIQGINNILTAHEDSKHLKVVSTKWNGNGNCVVFTRADQTAAELEKFKDRFVHLITGGRQSIVREDKKWIKIQANGIRTGAFDRIPGIYSSETIHAELCANNPAYANLQFVGPPRWMRIPEELHAQAYSSIVFAVLDEEKARFLLREIKSLAAFGRNAFLRKYADRPPVIQCKNCWGFEHVSTTCNAKKPRCRLCGQNHHENEHSKECTQCRALRESEGMDTDSPLPCTHGLRCLHCKDEPNNHPSDARRCPERIRRYGTARSNERPTATRPETGEWQTVTRGRRAPTKQTTRHTPSTHNRFAALPDESPSIERILANAPPGTTHEQAQEAMQHFTNQPTNQGTLPNE